MKKYLIGLKPLGCGILIGTMGVMPGVSGGALAAAFGYYELLIFAAAHPLKALKNNTKTLCLLLPGIGIGVVLFGKLFLRLFAAFPTAMRCTVAGMILGTLLSTKRERYTIKTRVFRWSLSAVAFALGVFLFYGKEMPSLVAPFRFEEWMLCGGIYALGTVVPGISASCILLAMDAYEQTLAVLAGENMAAILPFFIGFGIVAAGLICIVNRLYTSHKTVVEAMTTGFVASSIIPVIPPIFPNKTGVMAALCGLMALAMTVGIGCKEDALYSNKCADLSDFG